MFHQCSSWNLKEVLVQQIVCHGQRHGQGIEILFFTEEKEIANFLSSLSYNLHIFWGRNTSPCACTPITTRLVAMDRESIVSRAKFMASIVKDRDSRVEQTREGEEKVLILT